MPRGFLGVSEAPTKLPRRFRRLPTARVLGREVRIASSRRSRLLGLALLDRGVAGGGLLIPGCRSVHTFGMRFPLDLYFLDQSERPVSVRRGVSPGRVVSDWRASVVLELPALAEAA